MRQVRTFATAQMSETRVKFIATFIWSIYKETRRRHWNTTYFTFWKRNKCLTERLEREHDSPRANTKLEMLWEKGRLDSKRWKVIGLEKGNGSVSKRTKERAARELVKFCSQELVWQGRDNGRKVSEINSQREKRAFETGLGQQVKDRRRKWEKIWPTNQYKDKIAYNMQCE
jgi:hypothetical protein